MSAAHTNRVNSATFLPDGRYIVSGSDGRTIRVWDCMVTEDEEKVCTDGIRVLISDGRYMRC